MRHGHWGIVIAPGLETDARSVADAAVEVFECFVDPAGLDAAKT